MESYLIEAALKAGINMTREQAERFSAYHRLLTEANKEMNLTRVPDDINEACDRNYIDSLTPLKYMSETGRLIDVGSGAGFPGLPIAIMRSEMEIVLLDSLGKRVEFLKKVAEALELKNISAVHMRCEDAGRNKLYRDGFDYACARAVSRMEVLSEWLLPFVKTGGKMLALKGPAAEDETRDALPAIKALNGRVIEIADAEIPGRDWQHKIVIVEKTAPTPAAYPRKAGTAEKRPIRA